MTTQCAAIKSGVLAIPARDYGYSEEALSISRQQSDIYKELLESVALGGNYARISQAISEAARESSTDNWDGYGARALRPDSLVNALRFTLMLPTTIQTPDVSVDPDGMIQFEWYRGPRSVFSVTVESNRALIYAGLFGPNKSYGTEIFAEELPKAIFDNLERLLSQQF